MSQKFNKLVTLLKELFQLDQPDLDFGLYRIMHAKSGEITQFLETDLLPQVQAAFGEYQTADKAELEKELAKVIAGVEAAGMNADDAPKVKELRAKIADDAVDVAALESEVYDHLYSFFRRYYHEGDFLSKRVYKPGVYAIPYEGEEVKLHWANKDQYYIKTSEYLRDYAFRLRPEDEAKPMRVHFKLVDASEGEHGNVKATEGKDRVFVLSPAGDSGHDFLSLENDELSIAFEYRPATIDDWSEETKAAATAAAKKKPPVQSVLLAQAAKTILEVAHADYREWIAELNRKHVKADGEQADYSRLDAHLRRYSARNTFDYFIHKDLGGFLKRELDFYIKNEVMHLDDIENETVARAEQYLSKIKVIRKIAGKLIAFLAQLEDFQKKLWLKKKFVVETNYCITLDRIPEEFYPKIAANDAQREEWVKLFAIDEIESSTVTPKYNASLCVDFLKANSSLVLDTKFFTLSFNEKLIAEIEHLEESCDGLLVHSENSQSLNLIGKAITQKVANVFIDPPYNTGDDGFLYRDSYSSSTWLTMIDERIDLGMNTLCDTGVLFISIGDEEQEHLSTILRQKYGKDNFFANLIWEKKKKGSFLSGQIAKMKDYILCVSKQRNSFGGLIGEIAKESETYPCVNADNPREARHIPAGIRSKFREQNFIKEAGEVISAGNMNLVLISDLVIENGALARDLAIEGNWRYSQDSITEYARKDELYITQDLYLRRIVNQPRYKRMKDLLPRLGREGESDFRAYDINNLSKHGWGTNEDANEELHLLMGQQYAASYPKPSKLLTLLLASSRHDKGYWLDYFAGSGTTGHAVININRVDGGKRKFIMVEMGEYFDSVTIPRTKKVVYSKGWDKGKPENRETGISHCFKYIRLESYEDALNNLDPRRDDTQQDLLTAAASQGEDGLKEQYMLRYMLDVETRESPSLLNIQAFSDPTAYKLKVKRPGSDESKEVNVDLLETFNYLIGLTVEHIAAPQVFSAEFERDAEQRLKLNGRLKQDADGPYWFRTVTGTTPDGQKTLVIWRKLTGTPEEDNLVLDEWFTRQGYSTKDSEFQLIYVNGDCTLENLKTAEDTWKVRLLEEDFHRLMFDTEGM